MSRKRRRDVGVSEMKNSQVEDEKGTISMRRARYICSSETGPYSTVL
jgi:hypothetical protein